jgi:hypothetical protein
MNSLIQVDSDTAIQMLCTDFQVTMKSYASHICISGESSLYMANTKEFFETMETLSDEELDKLQKDMLSNG